MGRWIWISHYFSQILMNSFIGLKHPDQPLQGIVKRAELNKCDICLVSRILWHKRIAPSLKVWGLWDYVYSPVTFHYYFSLQVYAAPFQWRLLIFIEKNLWRWVLEANKKPVSLKSCRLKIRIDFVNQILRNKEKVKQPRNVNILTRTTDRKILYLYSCLSNDTKNRGPGPYNSLS